MNIRRWIWLGMVETMVQEMGRRWMLHEVGTIVSSNIVPGNYMLLLKHEQLKSYVKTVCIKLHTSLFMQTSSLIQQACLATLSTLTCSQL